MTADMGARKSVIFYDVTSLQWCWQEGRHIGLYEKGNIGVQVINKLGSFLLFQVL